MSIGDKIGNKFDDAGGKAKEVTGKATGNEKLENEGKGDQVKASIKDGFEKVKDGIADIKDSGKKA